MSGEKAKSGFSWNMTWGSGKGGVKHNCWHQVISNVGVDINATSITLGGVNASIFKGISVELNVVKTWKCEFNFGEVVKTVTNKFTKKKKDTIEITKGTTKEKITRQDTYEAAIEKMCEEADYKKLTNHKESKEKVKVKHEKYCKEGEYKWEKEDSKISVKHTHNCDKEEKHFKKITTTREKAIHKTTAKDENEFTSGKTIKLTTFKASIDIKKTSSKKRTTKAKAITVKGVIITYA